ncbi:MAG TPA: hemerythrin domain-containing protein [Orrella sp.]
MATSFMGFDAITASTDDPVGMLSTCHGRVRKQCATLKTLMPHLHTKGADDEAAAGAHRVMRYFDEAAVHHYADDEEDLFPRLMKALQTNTLEAAEKNDVQVLLSRLRQEHASLGAGWQTVRTYLLKVRSHQLPDLAAMQPLIESFTQANEAHTALEDEQLLPLAARLLKASALESLGQQMKSVGNRAKSNRCLRVYFGACSVS